MALDLTKIRVIVYDLDGTLYDDNRHFELYAREIQSRLPEGVREAFWNDYSAVVEGRHPALRIGTFFDVDRDFVLETRGGKVLRALHWDGSEVPPVVRQHLYPGVVEPDHNTMFNVGDLWWVPSAVAAHYGGSREANGEAFLRIRDVMADPGYQVEPMPHLKEAIAALKGKVVQVLATNSPQPDSEAILTKVGLLGLFDKMYFRSNKPAGLKQIFAELATEFNVDLSAVLSVGDNMVNEIAPATAMGCQTVFIDPHRMGDEGDADLRVETMAEFIPTLHKLAQ